MRAREDKNGRRGRAMRWAGLVGLAWWMGLAAPGLSLGQWEGGDGTDPLYDLNSNSKVGIGTSSPANDLHVKGQSGQGGRIQIQAGVSSKEAALQFFDASELRWGISSRNAVEAPNNRLGFSDNIAGAVTERLTLLQGGNVGIGTSNPGEKLDVAGNVGIKTGGQVNFGTAGVALPSDSSAGWKLKLYDSATAGLDFGLGIAASEMWLASGGKFTLRPGGGYLTSGEQGLFTIASTGKVGIGRAEPAVALEVDGKVHGGGPGAGLSFGNRQTASYSSGTGERWEWYSDSGVARLWSGADKLAVKSSGEVGVGTSSPTYKLHVGVGNSGLRVEGPGGAGTLASFGGNGDFAVDAPGVVGGRLVVKHGGSVGIGTTSPATNLHLQTTGSAPASLAVSAANSSLVLKASQWGPNEIFSSKAITGDLGRDLVIYTLANLGESMRITASGAVGIGTTTPQSKLAVNGTITTKDVTVTTVGWADHVFAEGYELMALSELGRYIEQHRRLPGVPSAAEVAEKGVSLGQTQVKLLEKVEELTLHAIELGRQNEKLRADNLKLREELEQRTAALEERLARLEGH